MEKNIYLYHTYRDKCAVRTAFDIDNVLIYS